MYGRADGMPSFQLTVAVCAFAVDFSEYIIEIVLARSTSKRGLQLHQVRSFRAFTDRAADWRECLRPDKVSWQGYRIAAPKHVIMLLRGVVHVQSRPKSAKLGP
jgi:hypothetical protein